MNLLMLREDDKAQYLARELFGKCQTCKSGSHTVTWVIPSGGPKTVAIYSLPLEKMFLATGGGKTAALDRKRVKYSLFEAKDMDTRRNEMPEWAKSGVKEWNKTNRRKLTPLPLQEADIFLAVNLSIEFRDVNLGSLKAQLEALSKVMLPKETEQRGGYVAYTSLPQNRIIYPGTKIPPGLECVWYGTSGATNTAELLLTMAAGHKLKLPVRFDNYGETPQESKQGQQAMRIFARELQHVIGVKFKLQLLSTQEDILNKVGLPIVSVARQIELLLRHSVGLCYHRKHGHVKTNNYYWIDQNGHKTFGQLHGEGYRFGGAAIYWAFYAQAERKNFAAILYDGSKGGVHKLAKPWMTEPHGLWICPAGSFSIRPRMSDSPYDVIDPVKFLQALQRSNQTKQILSRLWELALERVPLNPIKVGSKIVVKVNDDGSIEIS